MPAQGAGNQGIVLGLRFEKALFRPIKKKKKKNYPKRFKINCAKIKGPIINREKAHSNFENSFRASLMVSVKSKYQT